MIIRKRKPFSLKLFTVAVVFFTTVVVLGFFRLQVSRLEQLLNHIDQRLERYSAEEIELKQVLSGLVSPVKIDSYCKDILGMDKVRHVEILRIPAAHFAATSAPEEPQKKWRSSAFF